MMPVATFAKARCYEQKGDLEKARAIYEEFIVANPENRWLDQAESSLRYVKQKIRAQEVAGN